MNMRTVSAFVKLYGASMVMAVAATLAVRNPEPFHHQFFLGVGLLGFALAEIFFTWLDKETKR